MYFGKKSGAGARLQHQLCLQSEVGKTPFSYLNEYRINQAAALLLTTNAPITEIAMDTGFDNMSYFIRQFKHCKGCTPSAFRKMEHPGAVPIV